MLFSFLETCYFDPFPLHSLPLHAILQRGDDGNLDGPYFSPYLGDRNDSNGNGDDDEGNHRQPKFMTLPPREIFVQPTNGDRSALRPHQQQLALSSSKKLVTDSSYQEGDDDQPKSPHPSGDCNNTKTKVFTFDGLTLVSTQDGGERRAPLQDERRELPSSHAGSVSNNLMQTPLYALTKRDTAVKCNTNTQQRYKRQQYPSSTQPPRQEKSSDDTHSVGLSQSSLHWVLTEQEIEVPFDEEPVSVLGSASYMTPSFSVQSSTMAMPSSPPRRSTSPPQRLSSSPAGIARRTTASASGQNHPILASFGVEKTKPKAHLGVTNIPPLGPKKQVQQQKQPESEYNNDSETAEDTLTAFYNNITCLSSIATTKFVQDDYHNMSYSSMLLYDASAGDLICRPDGPGYRSIISQDDDDEDDNEVVDAVHGGEDLMELESDNDETWENAQKGGEDEDSVFEREVERLVAECSREASMEENLDLSQECAGPGSPKFETMAILDEVAEDSCGNSHDSSGTQPPRIRSFSEDAKTKPASTAIDISGGSIQSNSIVSNARPLGSGAEFRSGALSEDFEALREDQPTIASVKSPLLNPKDCPIDIKTLPAQNNSHGRCSSSAEKATTNKKQSKVAALAGKFGALADKNHASSNRLIAMPHSYASVVKRNSTKIPGTTPSVVGRSAPNDDSKYDTRTKAVDDADHDVKPFNAETNATVLPATSERGIEPSEASREQQQIHTDSDQPFVSAANSVGKSPMASCSRKLSELSIASADRDMTPVACPGERDTSLQKLIPTRPENDASATTLPRILPSAESIPGASCNESQNDETKDETPPEIQNQPDSTVEPLADGQGQDDMEEPGLIRNDVSPPCVQPIVSHGGPSPKDPVGSPECTPTKTDILLDSMGLKDDDEDGGAISSSGPVTVDFLQEILSSNVEPSYSDSLDVLTTELPLLGATGAELLLGRNSEEVVVPDQNDLCRYSASYEYTEEGTMLSNNSTHLFTDNGSQPKKRNNHPLVSMSSIFDGDDAEDEQEDVEQAPSDEIPMNREFNLLEETDDDSSTFDTTTETSITADTDSSCTSTTHGYMASLTSATNDSDADGCAADIIALTTTELSNLPREAQKCASDMCQIKSFF